jgi:hypothetical protein
VQFYFLYVFSLFYRFLEEKEAFLKVLDLKKQISEKLEVLKVKSIAGDLRSSALLGSV